MLVLTRKLHESIVINDDITIVVVEIRGNKVRLGIEAPEEVPVNRAEIALLKRSTDEQKAFIRRALANRIPLHRIEAALDAQENQE